MGHSQTVFGRRLRQARERRGLSQRQLGILAGIDASSASPRINQYEMGKHLPNPAMAERLSKVLGIPAPYLYARDDALAAWILAFDSAPPRTRRSVVRSGAD